MITTAHLSVLPGSQPAFSLSLAFGTGTGTEHTLMGWMYNGFYASFMLKNGNAPQANADLINKITQFPNDFTHSAKKQGASPDDIDNAKYTLCATEHEIILRAPPGIRVAWKRRLLQLVCLTAHLGDEIVHMTGKQPGFAPHAERYDQIIYRLRSMLGHGTEKSMSAYNDVVRLAPKQANLTITLP